MPSKKSALLLEDFSLPSRNSIASTTPIGDRIRRNTHKLIRRQSTWLRRLPDIVQVAASTGVAGLLRALETPVTGENAR